MERVVFVKIKLIAIAADFKCSTETISKKVYPRIKPVEQQHLTYVNNIYT